MLKTHANLSFILTSYSTMNLSYQCNDKLRQIMSIGSDLME